MAGPGTLSAGSTAFALELLGWCSMPNHVHLLVRNRRPRALSETFFQWMVLIHSAASKWSGTVLFKDIFPEGVEGGAQEDFATQMGDKAAAKVAIRKYQVKPFYSPEKRDTALAKMNVVPIVAYKIVSRPFNP